MWQPPAMLALSVGHRPASSLRTRSCVIVVVRAFLPLLLGGLPAARADGFSAVGTTALVIDPQDGTFVQDWSAACEFDDRTGDEPGAILTVRRELRFAADPVQVLAAGDGTQELAIVDGGTGSYRWTAVDGVYAFARLHVRCGGDVIFDERVVDSGPVIAAPRLEPPWAVTRTDDLSAVGVDAIPAGTEVELTGLTVRAEPRGDDVVQLRAVGAGLDVMFAFEAIDFVDGELAVAPRLRPVQEGVLVLTAALRGAASAPTTLTVVAAGDRPGGGAPTTPPPSSGGCAASGPGEARVLLAFALVLLVRDRSTAARWRRY